MENEGKRSVLQNPSKWLEVARNNKTFVLAVLVIIAVHLGLRLYRLELTQFDYDQEMILTNAKKILEGDLTLLGTRVGNYPIYVGPLYFYFTALFLWLFGFHPLVNMIQATFWATLALALGMGLAYRMYGRWASLIAGGLMALSPFFVNFDRIAWNDNPLTTLMLLSSWALYEILLTRRPRWQWYGVLGVASGLALNCHFMGVLLVLVPLLLGIVFKKWTVKRLALFLVPILVLLSPLILFEFRHNFLNIRGVLTLIVENAGTQKPTTDGFVERLFHQLLVTLELFTKLVMVRTQLYPASFVGLLVLVFYWLVDRGPGRVILVSYLAVTTLLLGIYQGDKPEYYLLILAPLCLLATVRLFTLVKIQPQWLWVPVLLLVFSGLLSQSGKVFAHYRRQGQQLRDKILLLEDVKDCSQGKPVKIEYKMHPGWMHGYGYLIDYLDVPIDDASREVYRITYGEEYGNKFHYHKKFGELYMTYSRKSACFLVPARGSAPDEE